MKITKKIRRLVSHYIKFNGDKLFYAEKKLKKLNKRSENENLINTITSNEINGREVAQKMTLSKGLIRMVILLLGIFCLYWTIVSSIHLVFSSMRNDRLSPLWELMAAQVSIVIVMIELVIGGTLLATFFGLVKFKVEKSDFAD